MTCLFWFKVDCYTALSNSAGAWGLASGPSHSAARPCRRWGGEVSNRKMGCSPRPTSCHVFHAMLSTHTGSCCWESEMYANSSGISSRMFYESVFRISGQRWKVWEQSCRLRRSWHPHLQEADAGFSSLAANSRRPTRGGRGHSGENLSLSLQGRKGGGGCLSLLPPPPGWKRRERCEWKSHWSACRRAHGAPSAWTSRLTTRVSCCCICVAK